MLCLNNRIKYGERSNTVVIDLDTNSLEKDRTRPVSKTELCKICILFRLHWNYSNIFVYKNTSILSLRKSATPQGCVLP